MTEEVAAADLLADGQLQLGVSRGPPNRAGNEVREKAALFGAAIAGAGVVRADIGGRGLLATASTTNYFFGIPGQDEELELRPTTRMGRGYELSTVLWPHRARACRSRCDADRVAGPGIEPEREPYRVREGGSRIWFVPDPDS
jgi:hypothetical protein